MDVVKRVLDSRLFWLVTGVVGCLAVANIAHRQLRSDPRFLAYPRFDRARLPPWGERSLLDPVIARLEAMGPISMLDPDFEERIRGALADCPVLERVTEVRREWPRSYHLRVSFRRPCAVVLEGEERIPVTHDGIRLPAEAYDLRGLYVITGVPVRMPEPGERVESESLRDGIATLRQLAPHLVRLPRLGIHTIDVRGAAAAREGVVLKTSSGIPVRWGRPRAPVGENAVETKVAYLLAAEDRLAALAGYAIDVRYGEPYVRESPSP